MNKRVILILLLLQTKVLFAQINNSGFEVWDTTYAACYEAELITNFGVPNPLGGVVSNWPGFWCGVAQTTDSYSGNYSLLLYNWYNYAHGMIAYHDSISYSPQYLQGVFKYITGGVDGLAHGKATITLTRFNGSINDTIATGVFQFDSIVSFTPFEVTLNYISALNPDSMHIDLISAETSCASGIICHLLYLDNLTLSNTPLNVANLNSTEYIVNVFPNPSIDKLNVQNNSAQLVQFTMYNSLNEKIIDKALLHGTSVIDLSAYANAIYFYKLSSGNTIIKSGKIVKQ